MEDLALKTVDDHAPSQNLTLRIQWGDGLSPSQPRLSFILNLWRPRYPRWSRWDPNKSSAAVVLRTYPTHAHRRDRLPGIQKTQGTQAELGPRAETDPPTTPTWDSEMSPPPSTCTWNAAGRADHGLTMVPFCSPGSLGFRHVHPSIGLYLNKHIILQTIRSSSWELCLAVFSRLSYAMVKPLLLDGPSNRIYDICIIYTPGKQI